MEKHRHVGEERFTGVDLRENIPPRIYHLIAAVTDAVEKGREERKIMQTRNGGML